MTRILKTLESTSCQCINFQKSKVMFTRNVSLVKRSSFLDVLGVVEGLGNKYLALPSLVGRSRKFMFGYIKDRVWKVEKDPILERQVFIKTKKRDHDKVYVIA